VFDKTVRRAPETPHGADDGRIGPEDERIALRCNRKELQLLDSFVANGEFRSRSELMRRALQEFLRARAMSAVTIPAARAPGDLVEVPVRLRSEEVEAFETYAAHVANGQTLGDVLAQAVRRGEVELKVSELARRARSQIQEAAENRASLSSLKRSAEDLERRGVVGR
jgi:Arc/MetJ-type ribon-helix-helix transcriptional regulator